MLLGDPTVGNSHKIRFLNQEFLDQYHEIRRQRIRHVCVRHVPTSLRTSANMDPSDTVANVYTRTRNAEERVSLG